METLLGKHSSKLYAALRIVAGLLFVQHGMQNVFGWFGGTRMDGGPAPFLSALFFAGVIELIGGTLIAVGFRASWAAFLSSGEMAVAYWWKLAPQGWFPIQNHGELAVLYCFVFLFIASQGSGAFSLDAVLQQRDESG